MTDKSRVRGSGGNVITKLGIVDSQDYLARAQLAARILRIVQGRRLTQAAASKLLGIPQPKVSALLNGRTDGFSTDRLFRFLNKLGCDIQIKVSNARPRSQGRVRVTAA